MTTLTSNDIQLAREWVEQMSGCTCPTEFDGNRYVVRRHVCDYCQDMFASMTGLGIGSKPKTDQSPNRRRKAA